MVLVISLYIVLYRLIGRNWLIIFFGFLILGMRIKSFIKFIWMISIIESIEYYFVNISLD